MGSEGMQTLKEARAARLLTVRGLAERAGVAPSTVYLIESGRSMPRFTAITKIAGALGVAPGDVTEFAAAIAGVASGKATAAAGGVSPDGGGLRNPRTGDTRDAKESGG